LFTVLLTGASQGIGRALVSELARRGAAHIVIAARNVQKLEQARAQVNQQYPNTTITVIPSDISSKEASQQLISQAMSATHNQLDVLLLNHITNTHFGTWLSKFSQPGGHDFVEQIFAVNTLSYIWLTTFAWPHLLASGGRIGVVSSLAGHAGNPKIAAYSASKHALEGFFNAFRNELKLDGVHNVSVTTCAIGATDTEGTLEVRSQFNSAIVQFDPPEPAADAILRGVGARRRTIYHPHYQVFPASLLSAVWPELLDWVLTFTLA
jgi:corticosteroid 11-beta-dehydrogenase isozyme 1